MFDILVLCRKQNAWYIWQKRNTSFVKGDKCKNTDDIFFFFISRSFLISVRRFLSNVFFREIQNSRSTLWVCCFWFSRGENNQCQIQFFPLLFSPLYSIDMCIHLLAGQSSVDFSSEIAVMVWLTGLPLFLCFCLRENVIGDHCAVWHCITPTY